MVGRYDQFQKCSVYVSNLDYRVTDAMLREAFLPFGPIISVNIPVKARAVHSLGFAFIDFERQEDAMDAIDNMHGAEFHGQVLKVTPARGSRMALATAAAEPTEAGTYPHLLLVIYCSLCLASLER